MKKRMKDLLLIKKWMTCHLNGRNILHHHHLIRLQNYSCNQSSSNQVPNSFLAPVHRFFEKML